jgi:hypothetical protein
MIKTAKKSYVGVPSAAMARLTLLIVTKYIFFAVNGLVCQMMVTPL